MFKNKEEPEVELSLPVYLKKNSNNLEQPSVHSSCFYSTWQPQPPCPCSFTPDTPNSAAELHMPPHRFFIYFCGWPAL